MLRLPELDVARPRTVQEAVELLQGEGATVIAGGTDLLPNLKHRLAEPELLVALDAIPELSGVREADDGGLAIGAMTPLSKIAGDERAPPALAEAAASVASPQIRRVGTLGGNLLSGTRCRYYNQSEFWRRAIGYCLKKDGTECHVVAGGTKCVAALTSDTACALMTLGAELVIAGDRGRRTLALEALFRADGAAHTALERGEILVEVRIPPLAPGHRGAYGKLRLRRDIDFPQLGVAVRVDLDAFGVVASADVVCGALAARPVRVRGVTERLRGQRPGDRPFVAAVHAVGEQAFARCHPLPNVVGDPEWRREMVRVIVRRTLLRAVELEP